MDHSTPHFPVLHCLPEFAQAHVHWLSDAIQPSYPLSSPFPPTIQSFLASGYFSMSQLFASCVQSIGASASASILPMNIQDWFPLGLTGWISYFPRDSQESSPKPHFESINSLVLSLLYGPTLTPIHDYWTNHQFSSAAQSCPTLCDPMNRSTPGIPVHHQLPEFTQTHVHRVSDAIQPSRPLLSPSPPAPSPSHVALPIWTFVGKRMSLLFITLSFTLQPWRWLQPPSAVILEPKKTKSVTVSIPPPPSICHEVMGPDALILVFWMLTFKPAFSHFSFNFIKRLFGSSLLSAI